MSRWANLGHDPFAQEQANEDTDEDAIELRSLDISTTEPTSSKATSDETQTHYVYEPLSTSQHQTRLIRLWRATSYPWVLDEDIDFGCTIDTFQFKSAPSYVALSYTWGSPAPTHAIVINGKHYSVGDNLYNFLATFSKNGMDGRFMWVDQICIDQTNTRERNEQVRRMASIYLKSHHVVAWLDRSAHTAATGLRDIRGPNFKSLHSFLGNRYFSRLWIIQELLLAQDAYFICCEVWLRWNDIKEAIALIGPIHFDRLPNSKWLFLTEWDYDPTKRVVSRSQPRLSLRDCLLRYAGNECADPRDKIYGLLGLLKKHIGLPSVDYDKSLQEVFIDTAQCLLDNEVREDYDFTLSCAAWDIINLSRKMRLPKEDTKAVENMFKYIGNLPEVGELGLQKPVRSDSNCWWYVFAEEEYYFVGDGLFLDMPRRFHVVTIPPHDSVTREQE